MVATARYVHTRSPGAMADHLRQATEPAEERDLAASYAREPVPAEELGTVARPRRDMAPAVSAALAIDRRRPATREEVVELAAGRRADGAEARQLRRRDGVDFVDITLSTDITWGIARWNSATPAGRAIVDSVVNRAADDAMAFAERELGFTRRGDGGKVVEAGSLGWLRFAHHTARETKGTAAAPDFHLQHLVPNAVVTGRGHVGAIDLKRMSGFLHVIGAYFHARLATLGREAGMRVHLDERTGAAVLSDIPTGLRGAMAKRTEEAKAEARAYAKAKGLGELEELPARLQSRLIKIGARRTQSSGRDGMAQPETWREEFARHGLERRDMVDPMRRPAPLKPAQQRAELAYGIARHWLEAALERRPVLPAAQLRVYAFRAMVATGIEKPVDANRVIALFAERGIRGPDGMPMRLVFGSNPARGGVRCVTTEAHATALEPAEPPRGDAPAREHPSPLLQQAVEARRGAVQAGQAIRQHREVSEGQGAAVPTLARLAQMARAARAMATPERVEALQAGAAAAKAASLELYKSVRNQRAERLGFVLGRMLLRPALGLGRAAGTASLRDQARLAKAMAALVARAVRPVAAALARSLGARQAAQAATQLAQPRPVAAIATPDPATALTRKAQAARDATVNLRQRVKKQMSQGGAAAVQQAAAAARVSLFNAEAATQPPQASRFDAKPAAQAPQPRRAPAAARPDPAVAAAERKAAWDARDRAELDEIRQGLRANAETAARDILGKPTTTKGHEARYGKKGSLVVYTSGPKAGRWRDFEGGEGADLLKLYQRERGGDFKAAKAWARGILGMPEPAYGKITAADRAAQEERAAATRQAAEAKAAERNAEKAAEDAKRLSRARWHVGQTVKVDGTVAERYLIEARKIPRPDGGWPDAVRFHPRRNALALVATGEDGSVRGIQIVHLTADGTKRPEEPGRPVKQSFGLLEGVGVRLPGQGTPVAAEGPETGLSVWAATRQPVIIALGSVSHLQPPQGRAVIAADDDAPGSPADAGRMRTVERWKAAGTDVRVAYPWPERRGDKSDFNDAIKAGGAAAVAKAIRNPPALEAAPGGPAPKAAPAAKPKGPRVR